MSKQENRVSLKSIAQFPDKLNTFAMFLIVILYGALLYLITSLSFPPVDYRVGLKNLDYVPGKEAHNEEINPFVLVRGTVVNKSEDEGKVDLGVQYRVYAYIDAVENKRPLGVKYFYSLTDKEGKTWFLYESKTGTDTPVTSTPYRRIVSHYIVGSNIEIGKDAITDLYMKVKYNIGEEKNKVYKVTEKVLGIRKSELNAAVFKTEGVLDDILEVTFSFKKTDNEKYSTNFTLDFLKDIENPFHLNLQSWIVSESGKIYPLLGLYNYRSPKKFNPTLETTVYKYVQPEYIYLKLEFTDHENAIRRLYYKTAISDLLGE